VICGHGSHLEDYGCGHGVHHEVDYVSDELLGIVTVSLEIQIWIFVVKGRSAQPLFDVFFLGRTAIKFLPEFLIGTQLETGC
jgi:hypothetical protein